MPPSLKALLAGSLSGLFQLIFIAVLALISVPLLMARLGAEAYGVFAVTSLTLTLPVFTSLGLTRSLVKFLSQQGKSPGSNNDLVVAVSLLAGFTLVVMALLFFSRTVVVNTLFGIPPPFQAQAGTLFLLLLGALLPLALGQAANAVIAALQRVWLSNLLMMIYNALFYGSMIILLMLGYGLVEIGFGILISALAWMLLSAGFALHHWGSLRTQGLAVQFRPLVQKHLGYGLRVYLAEGVAWFVEPVSKILLSNFIGITEAGYFDIAIRVKAQFQGLLTRLLDPFFPYISQVQEQPRLQRIIAGVERKFLLLSLPLTALLIFALPPLLDLWLGAGNNRAITLASILITATFLVTMAVLPFYYYLLSKDQAAKATRINLLTVAANAILFFIFLRWTGFYAAVIALCGSALVNFIASLHYQQNLLETGIFATGKQRLNLLVAFLIMVAVNYVLTLIFHDPLLLLALLVVATVCLMLLSYRWLGIIGWEEVVSYFGKIRDTGRNSGHGTRDAGHGTRDGKNRKS